MKALRVLGVIILILIAIFLVIPFFLTDNVMITSEKVIDASPSTVFRQVNMLKNWKNWSPFEVDTTMVDTYEGPEAGVGAKRIWSGEKVGEGSLTIVESKPYSLIKTKLVFGPDEGGATGTWSFKEAEEGVDVQWTIHITDLSYPFERWYGLMSKSVMLPLMEKGLDSLKKVAETTSAGEEKAASEAQTNIRIVNLKAQPSLTILDSTTISGIGDMLSRDFGAIMSYIQKKNIPIMGLPFAVYYNWDPTGTIVIRAGVPVPEGTKGHKNVEYFELPAGRAIFARHFGGYDTGKTHYAIDDYVKAHGITNLENFIWEVYVTDPSTEPDSTKWETDIYYPLK